jgi:uncharacterized protein involved in exopolysaccharide biosynthesis
MTKADVTLDRPSDSAPQRADMNLDVGDLFEAVVSRWRLFVVALAFTFLLAGSYVVVTPKRYAATMSFLLDNSEHLTPSLNMSAAAPGPEAPLVENQMRVLTSKKVLERTYQDLGLESDPEFGESPRAGLLAGLKSLIFGKPNAIEPSLNAMTDKLAHAIIVKRADKSFVIDVEARASSPARAERIARGLASAYLATQRQFSADVAETEQSWLDAKIDGLRKRLKQAEAQVQDYRESQSLGLTDGQTPSEQQMKTANAALVEARTKRVEAEAKYDQIRAAAQAATLDFPREAIRSPLLDRLLADYAALSSATVNMQATLGPRHPAIVANRSQLAAERSQIDREMRNIREIQRGNVLAARTAEQSAAAHVAALSKAIADDGGKRQQLSALERQASILRDNYDKALAARESSQAEAVNSPNPVLISQPLAQDAPVSPKAMPALIIAVVGAVNLWIASALCLEFLARRRRIARRGALAIAAPDAALAAATQAKTDSVAVPEECSPLITLPMFGSRASEHRACSSGDEAETFARAMRLVKFPDASFSRALARLRAAMLARRTLPDSPALFAMTAREEKSGVTTLALALALVACERGDRVLVIDCNLQHPTLSALLPYLQPAGVQAGRCVRMFSARLDPLGGGRLLLGRYAPGDRLPTQAAPGVPLDLILLDCGLRTRLDAALEPALTGFIEIDGEGGAGLVPPMRAAA